MRIFSKDAEKGERANDADDSPTYTVSDVQDGVVADNVDKLQRHLDNRHIQLIAIGGAIGTALFISIASTGLYRGGPGSLLLAYSIQSIFLALVNNSLAEMSTEFPVAGGFIRLAGKWVDDALGFMVGWNFFFYEALLIPFEISAFALVLSYWSETVTEPGPVAGICIAVILAYGLINVLAVRAYGEAEFWLSGGKVILILSLFCFTFITMLGGNPRHDRYGFRYWNNPGSFKEYLNDGPLGRFEGFMGAIASAAFTVVGPEYISIVAAEAKRPRTYIKNAFKTVYYRFIVFFVGGALAVGIVCSSTDPALEAVATGKTGSSTAAASPYVIAMRNLGITVFPDIVNALLLTSIFSAGNSYCYCAIRNLYSLSLEGRAPRFLSKTTRSGVPIYCFGIVMIFPMLSLLQCGSSSQIVITWFSSLVTAGGLINYIVICITYIAFHRACRVQGVSRRSFSYFGYFQPYGAWLALIWMILVTLSYGYTSFKPWSVSTFFSNYTMQLFIPPLYFVWKLVHRTKIVKSADVDLVWERPVVDKYEASLVGPPTTFWQELGMMIGIGRRRKQNDRRKESVAIMN